MMKQYTKSVPSCVNCPNVLYAEPISLKTLGEYRCRATVYRNNVYRLIHIKGEGYIPYWCELPDVEQI
jgi:hypothetical protein